MTGASERALPSLTVVVPNYNHGHIIGEQLGAIFSQSIQPAKVLIVDDASADDSLSTIRGLISGRPNTELVCRQANSGVCAVINEGLRMAETECVAFLAADDLILPGFFEKSLDMLARHPQAALCSGVSVVQHRSGDSIIPHRTLFPSSTSAFLDPKRVLDLLLRGGPWVTGTTAILRRRPLLDAGGFPPELMSYTDGFMYQVLALRHGACFIPEPLAIWNRSDTGYAGATARDEGAMEQILAALNKRMSADFSDIFPAELIARSNARLLFDALGAKLVSFETRVRATAESVPPTRGMRLALVFVLGFAKALRVLLFCTLRYRDIPRVTLSKLSRRRFLPTER